MITKCPFLSHFPTLKHGFFVYDPDISNAARIDLLVGQNLPLAILNQVHGNKVIEVNGGTSGQEADGLVTNVKGVAIGIFTADCGPLLFYDPLAEVIGACHAGWRGAKAGIIHNTLNAMENLGAKRSQIFVSLGPTIQQENYEVGPEFPDLIGGAYDAYFKPSKKAAHHFFNLPKYIFELVSKENISGFKDIHINTFTGPYMSARRLLSEGKVHKKESNFSTIAIL
jgi:YfiH family protein